MALGLNETKSYLFASPDVTFSKLGMSEEGRGVPVKVSPVKLTSLRCVAPLFQVLRSIAYNLAHGVSIATYELGRVLLT